MFDKNLIVDICDFLFLSLSQSRQQDIRFCALELMDLHRQCCASGFIAPVAPATPVAVKAGAVQMLSSELDVFLKRHEELYSFQPLASEIASGYSLTALRAAGLGHRYPMLEAYALYRRMMKTFAAHCGTHTSELQFGTDRSVIVSNAEVVEEAFTSSLDIIACMGRKLMSLVVVCNDILVPDDYLGRGVCFHAGEYRMLTLGTVVKVMRALAEYGPKVSPERLVFLLGRFEDGMELSMATTPRTSMNFAMLSGARELENALSASAAGATSPVPLAGVPADYLQLKRDVEALTAANASWQAGGSSGGTGIRNKKTREPRMDKASGFEVLKGGNSANKVDCTKVGHAKHAWCSFNHKNIKK